MIKLYLALFAMPIVVGTAHAATIQETADITLNGQDVFLDMTINEAYASGTAVLTITLNGDFTSSNETARLSFPESDAEGSLFMAYTGERNNQITGLSLTDWSHTLLSGSDDALLTFEHEMTADLAATLLSETDLSIEVLLSNQVQVNTDNEDFVTATITYDSVDDVPIVPLPAGLPLLAGALGGLGFLEARRRGRRA